MGLGPEFRILGLWGNVTSPPTNLDKLLSRNTSEMRIALMDGNGGRYRIRTYDFHRVRMALYR